MNLERFRLRFRLPLAVASGLLLTLAFPPVDVRWLAFFALVPVALSLRSASLWEGLLCGAAFGLAFFGVLLAWIGQFGWLAWSALVVSQAVAMLLFGAFGALAGKRLAGRLVGWPVLFTALEIARSRWPLGGFAWGALGSSQHSGLPLLPLARVIGVFGVGLALVLINVLLAEALALSVRREGIGPRHKAGRVVAVALALGAGIGPAWLPLRAPWESGRIDVAMIQGNVPRGQFEGTASARARPDDPAILASHVRLSETLASRPPDLVIWPESVMVRDPFSNPDVLDQLERLIEEVGRPFLVNASLDGIGRTFYNSDLLFSADGWVLGRYDKTHLVPFGEYVPWGWPRKYISALDAVPFDALPGKGPVVFTVAGVGVGPVICFESTYPELVRSVVRNGAGVIVVSTNNASFGASPAARQHLAQSQMRAVEQGRVVLQAAISGISAVIGPDGSILQEAGLDVPAVLRQEVPVAGGLTPYGEWGGVMELGAGAGGALVGLIALIAWIRGPRRARRPAKTEEEEHEFWREASRPLPGLLEAGGERSSEPVARHGSAPGDLSPEPPEAVESPSDVGAAADGVGEAAQEGR